jgi:hypothetical protein
MAGDRAGLGGLALARDRSVGARRKASAGIAGGMRLGRAGLAPRRSFRRACPDEMVCEVAMGRPWSPAGCLLLASVLAVAGDVMADGAMPDDSGLRPLPESSLHAVALRGPAAALVPSPPPDVAGSPHDRASEPPRLLTGDDLARLAIGVVPVPPEPRPARPPPLLPEAVGGADAQLPAARPVLPAPAAGGGHGMVRVPVELDADALVAVGFSSR